MGTPRRKNNTLQETDNPQASIVAAVSATSTVVLQTMDRDYTVDKFEITIPGGYTSDDTNRYTITLQAGATVLATADLKTTGGGGTGDFADNVPKAATLAASHKGSAGDVLKVVITKNGSAANVPAGTRLVAHCHLL